MQNMQFVVFGGIAILLAGMFAIMSLHEITAQETNSTSQSPQMGAEIPQLNGSVNIVEQSNQFIIDSVQVTFATALETAQSEVGNGTAISGRLGVIQGYLVYVFKVANFDSQTARIVIVDAGNGAVLHTSGDVPLYFGGLGCGGGHHHKGFDNHWGMHGRGSGTLDRNNSGDQSFGSGMVVSPAIGA